MIDFDKYLLPILATYVRDGKKLEQALAVIKKLKDELQASNSDAAAFKKLHDTMIEMNDEKLQKTVKEYQQESDVTIKEFEKKAE